MILTRSKPIVVLEGTKHIEYVEGLYNRLQSLKDAISNKEDYIRSVASLGIKSHSVQQVADDIHRMGRFIHGADAALNKVRSLLNLGAEPTTPPSNWFCGHLEEPKKVKVRWEDGRRYPDETWPSYRQGRVANVFKSAIPADALKKYSLAKPHLDDVRIYSPNSDDFLVMRNPVPRDPVMIGKVTFLGQDEYFEIARWDIDKDLATIFSRP